MILGIRTAGKNDFIKNIFENKDHVWVKRKTTEMGSDIMTKLCFLADQLINTMLSFWITK